MWLYREVILTKVCCPQCIVLLFLNKVLCGYDILRNIYLMFHLETLKKCLSLIKHFNFACMCQLKG